MIRKITQADKEIYIQLSTEMYSSPAVLYRPSVNDFNANFQELMRSNDYIECYLFEVDNKVVGYALTAKYFSTEAGGMCMWIEELFVREEFRNYGIGKEFLDFIISSTANSVKRIRLEVEEYNKKAITLYERYGFHLLNYKQMILDR